MAAMVTWRRCGFWVVEGEGAYRYRVQACTARLIWKVGVESAGSGWVRRCEGRFWVVVDWGGRGWRVPTFTWCSYLMVNQG